MNKDQFWESIDTVIVAYPDHDRESHMNIIIEKLLNYSLDDIVDWQMMLEEYCNAAYRPEVWSAGQVLGADYTGEGFIDFACLRSLSTVRAPTSSSSASPLTTPMTQSCFIQIQ